ncbi:MAG: PBP1A family penicillin-binding protein [Melioribacteraceae bacterium]|nr:PBP1A family penicillin-binding protein [Melioribacteraceae bacterium]
MSKQNPKKKSKHRKNLFWSSLSFILILLLVGGFFYYQYIINGLPTLEELENPKQQLASIVYSFDGEEIGRFYKERRVEISIDSIPGFLVEALVSTEDKKFYEHWGVDLDRFLKAMVKTFLFGQKQGASTLTMQLAKQLYGYKSGRETYFDTITRKIREWITAVQIEKSYTKHEILEMYLNISFYGKGAYGIEMASRIYFNKKVQELTVPEAATLVALLKSHVVYNPVTRYNNALSRRNLVMREMVEEGHLSQADYQIYSLEPIQLKLEASSQIYRSSVAPYFVEYIRQKLEDMQREYGFNIYEDGLTIYTSLDTRMQKIANRVVTEHLDAYQTKFDQYWDWRKNKEVLDDLVDKAIKARPDYIRAAGEDKNKIYNDLKKNVAFVDSVQQSGSRIEVGFTMLSSKNGEIKVMVGGRDTEIGTGLNHVTQIKRQPGSSFKPIIYTVALDNGLFPAYPILNQPFDYNGWSPTNFEEDNIGGFLTLREAITNSVNLVAARLIIEGHVDLWKVKLYADKMGIKYRLHVYPAISLGASEVIPLELASVYATIANKGIYNEPHGLLSIEDKDGILIQAFTPSSSEAISEESAYMITNMLQSVVKNGTGRGIWRDFGFTAPCAGKTGTNGDYKDAWFMGFTPQLAGGVWVGFNDQRISFTGSYGQGAMAAMPVWAKFMKEVYDSLEIPGEDFIAPENGTLAYVDFCKESIYELGDPRMDSPDCKTGVITDLIKITDIPPVYNAERDTTLRFFNQYPIVDTLAHEAIEIK